MQGCRALTASSFGLPLRLLHGMLPFHNHFRHAHAELMRYAPQSQALPRRSLQNLLQQSLQLCGSLEMHHKIEEAHIFPLLAVKLPSFGTANPIHLNEHAAMHAKLDELEHFSSQAVRNLQSQAARKLEAEGCGKEVEEEAVATTAESGGSAIDEGRKPWPTSIYDATRFEAILRELAAVLFPHLDAEEKSLRGSNLKEHGMTLQDIGRIPM